MPHVLLNGNQCCERSFNAQMMYVHASLYACKDIFHQALYKYLVLLFNHRNENGILAKGLREFYPNIDKSAIELYYNEDTVFTEEEINEKKMIMKLAKVAKMMNLLRIILVIVLAQMKMSLLLQNQKDKRKAKLLIWLLEITTV